MNHFKLKICYSCNNLKVIYKNIKGKKYCKSCTFKIEPTKKIVTTKPISQRSQKRIIQDKQYSKLRKQFLITNPVCISNLEGCTHIATQIHHKKGRGIYYLDTTKFLPICHTCHTWVTINSDKAIILGLSLSRLNK